MIFGCSQRLFGPAFSVDKPDKPHPSLCYFSLLVAMEAMAVF